MTGFKAGRPQVAPSFSMFYENEKIPKALYLQALSGFYHKSDRRDSNAIIGTRETQERRAFPCVLISFGNQNGNQRKIAITVSTVDTSI